MTPINLCVAQEKLISFNPEKLPINYAYIKSNGEIEPLDFPIERSGNVYCLIENVENYSIIIQKNGTIFHGKDYTMSLPSYGEKGEDERIKSAPGLITLKDVSNITVQNVKFKKCETAISVFNSSKIHINQNVIVSNYNGIFLWNGNNCSILKNIINVTDTAIMPTHSNYLDIKYNKISHYGESRSGMAYGISEDIYNSTIRGNIFLNFNIALYNLGSFNRIIENTFENNEYGILQNAPGIPFENNEIHHNNFINNVVHLATAQSSLDLDDGAEGNYWSNYNGTDNNGDGIGDIPVVIPTITIGDNDTNTDNYPLIEPIKTHTIPEFPSWIILPLFLTATLSVIVIRKKLNM